MQKGQPYSGEFKRRVVEDVLKNHLSYHDAMEKYGIKGGSTIQKWERVYLTESPAALDIERRGRKSTGRPPNMVKGKEEDLLTELERLRAENAYLKNLQALVLEDERRQHKKRW